MMLTEEDLETNIIDVSVKTTGIEDVIFYIGEFNGDMLRVKVSNVYSLLNYTDMFTITIPDYEIYGEVKIGDDKLSEIINFIKLNIDQITAYSNGEILSANMFLKSLIPIR